MKLGFVCAAILLFSVTAGAQGRRTVPNTTPEQAAAIAQMNAALAPEVQRVTRARTELVAAALTSPTDHAAMRARLDAIRDAEVALAHARATAFAELQSSANRLTADQVAALAAIGEGDRGSYRTSMPHVTATQASALLEMTGAAQEHMQALNSARMRVTLAALTLPRDDVFIRTKTEAIIVA